MKVRMKFKVLLFLSVLAVMLLLPRGGRVQAADYIDNGRCGPNLTYVLGNNGVLTIIGEGDMTNFSDAGSVPWFENRMLISSVVFDGDVTSIGAYAFDYCIRLSQISLPESVKGIGAYAFYGCSSLTEFRAPSKVTGIGAYAFARCSSLTQVTLPDGLISIGASAFEGCRNLGSIVVPESVTSIGKGAFDNSGIDDSNIAFLRGSCGENVKWELLGGRKLRIYGSGAVADYASGAAPWYANAAEITELVIADGVTGIGDFAFRGCTAIRKAALPGGITRIGRSAFEGCTGLSGFTFGASVAEIEDRAFFQSGLSAVEFSGSGKVSVGDAAFSECISLKRVSLQRGTFELGSNLFSGCTKLEEALVDASVKQMGSRLFSGCTALVSVSLGAGVEALGANLFEGCTALTEAVFPEGVKELPERMFSGCAGLTQAKLPDTVTAVGAGVFAGCSGLTQVTFSANTETIGTLAFQNCVGLKEIVIPESVKSFGIGAFSGCSGLTRMTLPFVGSSIEKDKASAETLFGYIFGTTAYEGGSVASQHFSDKGYCGYILPDALTEVTVTGGVLFDGAFDHCAHLTKITLSEGVTRMGSGVFGDCAGLLEVNLPQTLTEIPPNTFRGCAKLEEIAIPDSVASIGVNAFSGCALLADITLPKGLQSIGAGAFKGCAGLEDITFPEQITGIENEAFAGCTKLTAVDLPDRIVTVGKEAFAGCTGILRVTLPETMTEIGNGAFKGCTKITQVTVPGRITAVADSLFEGCKELKNVTFAGGVEAIGKGAFKGCVLLEKVTLPDTVTSVGDEAFSGCIALSSIALPDGVASIGNGAFLGCSGFAEITVPDGVTSIGSGAFSGCSGLLRIKLPFVGGSSTAAAASGSTLFGYIFGTAAYQGGTATKQYSSAGTVATYYIPDTLARVEITGGRLFYGAFYGCKNITELILPQGGGLAELAECAFYDCTGLKEIAIPDSVTAVGAKAFYNCTGLLKAELPAAVKRIGAYAFYGCSKLGSVLLCDGLLEIGANAFMGCSSLKEITVPGTVTSIQAAAFNGCSALESMVLPFLGLKADLPAASAQTLFGFIFGTAAFSDATATKQYFSNSAATYYIPNSLKHVTITGGRVLYGAFYNCSRLESITLPEGLTEIGNYAFRGCTALTGLTIPESVTAIGGYAFMDCANLSGITAPDGVESIGTYAFRGCAKLASFAVPEGVSKIEPYTFSGCTSLNSLTIPKSVTVIGTYAFQNCVGLSNLTVPDSVAEINIAAFSGCSGLERISLPFAGYSANQAQASARTLFGFVFGGTKFDGSTATKQFYSTSSATYYIPDTLKYVEIRGGKLHYGTFSGCSRLVSVILPKDLGQVGGKAFSGCSALEEVTFLGKAPSSIAQDAFTGVKASIFYPVTDASWAEYVGKQFGGTLFWEEHTHKYGQEVTEPTCTKPGYTTYQCLYCEKTYVIDGAPALGHDETEDEAVPATCTQGGKTKGAHCARCGLVMTKQETIPAMGHRFTDYVSNRDATYEADGTMTADCGNGCGQKDTRRDSGSMLKDQNNPEIEVALGNRRWMELVASPSFDLCFQAAQTVTVTARDEEPLLDGSTVNRLDKVYYYLSDRALTETQLRNVSWTEYKTALQLNPDGKFLVYVKAVDRSGNLSYASTDGILVDGTAPEVAGIREGAVYCGGAEFSVTDFSAVTVTDNGTAITPSGGKYTIAGDGRQHTVIASDACGNRVSVTITAQEGHIWQSQPDITPPTCMEQGYTAYRCRYCEQTNVTDYVPALGHDEVAGEAVPATCTKSGTTAGSYCARCSVVMTPQKTIPATGHRFTDYVSNRDATYEADGTKTADCGNGCGQKDTRRDPGSRLTDQNSPRIEITMGTGRWSEVVLSPSFDLCFQTAQDVTVTARDDEPLLDGTTVDRLDKVYYFISDRALTQAQLGSVSWTEYQTALRLEPDGRFLVYVKAVDRSGNVSYASTDGIQIDGTPPRLEGIVNGAGYCGKAEFTVTDFSAVTVTDNGKEMAPSGGVYTIAGDGQQHTVTAADACGNTVTVTVTVGDGHTWLVPVFAWGKDNQSCTAAYTCKFNTSHTQKTNCTVVKETTEATCVKQGREVFIATSTLDGIQKTNTRTITIEPLGHDYDVVFRWSEDKLSAEAVMTCRRPGCGEDTPGHTLSPQECTVETKVTEATCVLEGRKEVIASIVADGVEYEDTGSSETLPVNPENHVNTVIVGQKEPTDTKEGYTGDTKCEDCGKTVAYGEKIPAIRPVDPDKPADPDKPVDPNNPDINNPDPNNPGQVVQPPADKLPKKGSKLKDGKGNVYTVTKVGSAVAFKAPYSKKLKSVKIPETVRLNGVSYKVTSIAKSALKGCKNLKTVTIGKNISNIGAAAFWNCGSLKKITIKTNKLTAKRVGAKAFAGVHKKAEFKVPAKKLETYKKILRKKGVTKATQVIRK